MHSSWILASRAEPSWKFSELSRAELAPFEIRAETELDFFFKLQTFHMVLPVKQNFAIGTNFYVYK